MAKCSPLEGSRWAGQVGWVEEFRIILLRSVYWTGLLCLPLILVLSNCVVVQYTSTLEEAEQSVRKA